MALLSYAIAEPRRAAARPAILEWLGRLSAGNSAARSESGARDIVVRCEPDGLVAHGFGPAAGAG